MATTVIVTDLSIKWDNVGIYRGELEAPKALKRLER
jgi:hypothetical protein